MEGEPGALRRAPQAALPWASPTCIDACKKQFLFLLD